MHIVRPTRELPPFRVGINDVDEDRIVRLTAPSARTLLGRSGAPPSGEDGTGAVSLTAEQRQSLRVQPGGKVEVEEVELASASRVSLVATFASDLSRPEQAAVGDLLRRVRAPVALGARFRAPLADRATGVFEVTDIRVEPAAGEAVVGEDTEVLVRIPSLDELTDVAEDIGFVDVGGMHEVRSRLREAVELPLLHPELYREIGITPPRGVLLHGPPGAGKTYVARAIAHEIGAHFEYVNGPELVGTSYGKTESNLRQLFQQAARRAPTLILVDEIDALAPSRSALGSQADYRMVTQLLALLDGLRRVDGIILLGTTNRPDAIEPALLRPGRMDVDIFVAPPSAAERAEMIDVHFGRMLLDDEARRYLPRLSDETHGYLPADLMALARQAGLHALRRSASEIGTDEIIVTVDDVHAALRSVEPSLLRRSAVQLPMTTFDDIIGEGPGIEELRRDADAVARRSIPARILVAGPSGVGKTALAHAFADRVGGYLLSVAPADLYSSWLGETEMALRDLFRLATYVAPSVVLFERLEGFAPALWPGGSAEPSRRIAAQLMREVESLPSGVSVVATTEAPDQIDQAVRTRFSRFIELGPPSADSRRAFVIRHIARDDHEEIDTLVERTEGATFADILVELQRLGHWNADPVRRVRGRG